MRRFVAALAVLAAACQPVLNPLADQPTEQRSEEPRLGAPAPDGVPQSLQDLHAIAQERAIVWQEAPVVVEIRVEVGDDGAWTSAEVSYVAGDADRILTVRVTPDGVTEERLSLQTLQAQPVPGDALGEVPRPDGFREPSELLEAASECLQVPPGDVLYATGVPFTWDGTQWATEPEWRASVTAGGQGVSVDPQFAEADCSQPLATDRSALGPPVS